MINSSLRYKRRISGWLIPQHNLKSVSLSRMARNIGLLALTLLVQACATLDFDQPREASYVIQNEGSSLLSKRIAEVTVGQKTDSGFQLVKNGIDALSIRLLVIRRATKTVDAQYYTILANGTGYLFMRELLRAADRGVRVRLLIDDIATQGYDAALLAMDSHPNLEIRLRNPFSLRTGRYLNIRDYARVNRRMHNKSLIVDDIAMIVGGRNIGDEYFAANKYQNFADLDVFGVGPVAHDASEVFDAYWNDRMTLPVVGVAKATENPAADLIEYRVKLEIEREKLSGTAYERAYKTTQLEMAGIDLRDMSWVPYRLVSDPPDKGQPDNRAEQNLVHPISEVIKQAKQEFILVSPYFVPRKKGIEGFADLRSREVEVLVLTNSLAATDVAAVHSGYAPARKPLLKMGVKLYEVRADAKVPGTQRVGIKRGRASLHTKAFIVDREKIFIGSFNFDPRSVNLNTEMGIFLEAPALASEVAETLVQDLAKDTSTYEVVLNSKNQLRWLGKESGQDVRLNKEPQSGFWRRFTAGFLRTMPIRGQL